LPSTKFGPPVNQRLLSGPEVIPLPSDWLGTGYSTMLPEVLIRPMLSPLSVQYRSVNQRLPSGPEGMSKGWLGALGSRYSVRPLVEPDGGDKAGVTLSPAGAAQAVMPPLCPENGDTLPVGAAVGAGPALWVTVETGARGEERDPLITLPG